MSDELLKAVTSLAERLVTLAAHDEGLRADLNALARAIAAATERAAHPAALGADGPPGASEAGLTEGPEPGPATAEPVLGVPTQPEDAQAVSAHARLPLPELTLGQPRPVAIEIRPEPRPRAPQEPAPGADLLAIESRCRLKAEGIRWAATRSRRLAEGADFRVEIAPRDRDLLDRAKSLADCYLWMNTPEFTVVEPALIDDAAGCFEAVADSLALVRDLIVDIEKNREFFEQALDVLAEAQSALRVAVDRLGARPDSDQFQAYQWLRATAAAEQIYIRRYMRLDDPADPSRMAETAQRIEALDARIHDSRQRVKGRKSRISQLRYHAKLIGENKGGDHDWRKLFEAVTDLVEGGTPPSSVEVREALFPVIDKMDSMPEHDAAPHAFQLVLREVDRYLASRLSTAELSSGHVPSVEVAQARSLLGGKTAVLIGGSRRPDAHDALCAAFGLNELIWVETREHESIDRFEALVARAEVALVLLAIRWSSHSFGEVKRFCERYGKPLVRLPAGYNPNQVASQILAQCSAQLEAD